MLLNHVVLWEKNKLSCLYSIDMDVFRIKIKEEDDNTGMLGMALVTEPAIESEFLTFNKDKVTETVVVALKDEKGNYKQIVAGLALIPDKLIYRKNGDYEYYVFFTAEDIESIRNKFHKQKLTDVVNLQHTDETVQSYLVESYIINSEERLTEVKAQGIEDATMGSWYVQYKVEDTEVFEKALDKDINGFSIEIKGELVQVELNKNNMKQKISVMSKFNSLINKFKEVLQEFEEVVAKIADSDTTVIYTETGEPVYKEVVGEEDTVREAMPEGEYILDNGVIIVVDENGLLAEIKEEEAPDAIDDQELQSDDEDEEEENLEDKKDEDEEKLEEDEKDEEKLEEDEKDEEDEDLQKKIFNLIPKAEDGSVLDGSYSLEVLVENGAITYGTMYAYSYKDLQFQKEELEKQVEKLKKEPAAKPLSISEASSITKLTKEQKNKMNNLDLVKHRLGLD